MKRLILGITAIFAGALILKSCGEPYNAAKDIVEDFMEEIMEGEGKKAVQFIHPSYRDELVKNLKLPLQFTELRPTELLACVLSVMEMNIEDIDIKNAKMVNRDTAKVIVSVEDKEGLEKLFTFVVVKEGDRWYIVKIDKYVPSISE